MGDSQALAVVRTLPRVESKRQRGIIPPPKKQAKDEVAVCVVNDNTSHRVHSMS